MLDITGLGDHAASAPASCPAASSSGGHRACPCGAPQVLVADEPTGQLDSETARQIMRLLRTVVRSAGISALVATHDHTLLDSPTACCTSRRRVVDG